MSPEVWKSALTGAYDDFCARVDDGEDTEIDPYAAESPAEFFAVLSEVFFADPVLLRREYPDVYEQFVGVLPAGSGAARGEFAGRMSAARLNPIKGACAGLRVLHSRCRAYPMRRGGRP